MTRLMGAFSDTGQINFEHFRGPVLVFDYIVLDASRLSELGLSLEQVCRVFRRDCCIGFFGYVLSTVIARF